MKQYLEKRGIYITWSQLVMRIIFDLVGFLLALLPAGLTLYLTDVWITSGTHMPTSWILGIIVCVFLIHFYQFYFVNYNSQMNADRMAGNYRQHLAQKILSSSIPAYESQNKARIQNMANDVSAIYTVSSYLVTVPANLVKVKIYLARTLLGNSSCILLDEPGSNLDEKTEHSLINYLLKLKEKKLILVISHNAYYDAVADKTYEIRKGMMHPVQSH